MEIQIQIEKNLVPDVVVGTLVSEESDFNLIIGKIISYDTLTGLAICELDENIDLEQKESE
jgi:hypothetical protein